MVDLKILDADNLPDSFGHAQRIICPKIVTLIAGTPFNMTCSLKLVELEGLTLYSESIDTYTSEITLTD